MLDKEIKNHYYNVGKAISEFDYGIFIHANSRIELLEVFKFFIKDREVEGFQGLYKKFQAEHNRLSAQLTKKCKVSNKDLHECARAVYLGVLHGLKQSRLEFREQLRLESQRYKDFEMSKSMRALKEASDKILAQAEGQHNSYPFNLKDDKNFFRKLGCSLYHHDTEAYKKELQGFNRVELQGVFYTMLTERGENKTPITTDRFKHIINKYKAQDELNKIYELDRKKLIAREMVKGCLDELRRVKNENSDIEEPYYTYDIKSGSNNQTPNYYHVGSKEALEYIADIIKDLQGQEAFCCGNVLKYIIRYKNKNGVEDLKKAKHYIEKLIAINEVKHETK